MKVEVPSKASTQNMVDSLCVGTHYPNRIFVGSLPGKATATDLAEFFCQFGTVLEGKVVLDSSGRSRRFGFVTFASYQDVANVLNHGTIFYKGRRINVGPAVKKMPGATNCVDFVSEEDSHSPSYPSPPLSGSQSPIDYPQMMLSPPSPPPQPIHPIMMLVDPNQPPSPTGFSMSSPLGPPLSSYFIPNLQYQYMFGHSLPSNLA